MHLFAHTSRSTLLNAVDESLPFSNALYPSRAKSALSPKDRKTLPSVDILAVVQVYIPRKRSATLLSLSVGAYRQCRLCALISAPMHRIS